MDEQAIVSQFVADDEEREEIQEAEKDQTKKNKDKEEKEGSKEDKNESEIGKSNTASKNLKHAENGDLNESRKRKNSVEDDVSILS